MTYSCTGCLNISKQKQVLLRTTLKQTIIQQRLKRLLGSNYLLENKGIDHQSSLHSRELISLTLFTRHQSTTLDFKQCCFKFQKTYQMVLWGEQLL